MHILHLHHVTLSYAGRPIFTDLTHAIADRERTGIVGPNGSGKSSLLRLVAGLLPPDAGQVVTAGGIHIGYLPQDVTLAEDSTLLEEALRLPPRLARVEAQLSDIEARLADPAVYGDTARLTDTLEEQDTLLRLYDRLNGPRHPALVKKLLLALGFTEADYARPAATLSGGQKKLVALVRLAVAAPELLLLDEPDNHLDTAGKQHLERFIREYAGSVWIVSHDRYLLDDVATQIIEVDGGRLTACPGNYTAYTTQRELNRLRQQQLYVAQQKEIARIEAAIARFEQWASIVVDERHIRQARSRRKMLQRMADNGDIIDRVTDPRRIQLELAGWRGSSKVLELTHLSMAFGDTRLLDDVQLTLRHGERVGLVGENGAGKSILFRLILGELTPVAGRLNIAPGVKLGYYAQEHQTLAAWRDKTPLELVQKTWNCAEGPAVAFLMKLLFRYEQVRQPVHSLSGGERSRLQLGLLVLQQPNFLLLDEPTNNLDIASVEVLENVLEEFEGTVFTISHDRYFLDNVVDEIVELRGGRLRRYAGGYTDYVAGR
ncbi:MAG: ATP-binding cassette domain-containing protein [Anaerolineae bacterium]|nr:ATP-binding cassette domain-containing protein [Anaerolineae bacterium]